MNTLSIDSSGRVVFDATSTQNAQEMDDVNAQDFIDDAEVDLSDLGPILFEDPIPIGRNQFVHLLVNFDLLWMTYIKPKAYLTISTPE